MTRRVPLLRAATAMLAALAAAGCTASAWDRPYVASARGVPAPRSARAPAAAPAPAPPAAEAPEPATPPAVEAPVQEGAPVAVPPMGEEAAPPTTCDDSGVCRTPEAPRAPARRAPATCAATDDQGQAMFDLVNRRRAENGLRALRWNDRLHKAAYDHSVEQARYGYMGHGSPDPARDDLGDRVRLAGYSARQWGEVVGWGYAGPAEVVEGWMDSSGHRHILLDPDLEDVGFSRVGSYFTGDFGAPLPESWKRARRR